MNKAELLSYACNPMGERAKTYGSISKGLEGTTDIVAYRNTRIKHYEGLGIAYADRIAFAQNDVIEQFGAPTI